MDAIIYNPQNLWYFGSGSFEKCNVYHIVSRVPEERIYSKRPVGGTISRT